MVINLDPFNHNNFSTEATPQRENNSESEPQTNDHDIGLSDHIKLEDLNSEDPNLLPQVPDHVIGENFRTESETKTVMELKPYKCPQCPKRFSKMEVLQVHHSSHSGYRPFSCHICNKTFIRKRELDRHIATHSGMKPFKCTRCSKSFGRKDKLIRHMRIHDINKSFNCNLCGATFTRRDGLQQHMKTHAPKQESEDDQNVT
ncbi:hypothetical protein NQ317_010827 [Molorchus minor]|uniref:C2H2-type domain-containing protein n=1 Tax=Molorchus minor TaxID=1323400 RepID=A0ABQ9J452_9CUCU|nr:hypothetical protein NQ317_010827 [Molorchus minor]